MSSQITTAFVKQYSSNVFHLAQQKGSRLRGAVRMEMQRGEEAFYDRIGAATAVEKTGRHTDTPQIDTPHSRRKVTMKDFHYADLIDKEDKVRTLIDPTNEYAMAAAWALGRSLDDQIIAAAVGSAYAGVSGATETVLPSTQKIVPFASGAGSNLNVEALRHAKLILDQADVDPELPRFLACEASQIYSLLGQTEVTSSDYNVVKALAQGQIDSFMGFKFIRTQRLLSRSGALSFDVTDGTVGAGGGDADGYRRCFAWVQDGLLLSVGEDITGRIDERNDKSYATQIYAKMTLGATRMEEEKVVEILCNEG